jgi:hypothetical protein
MMRVQVIDLEVAGSLQPDQVEAYLGSKKWKKYSTTDFYSVWTSENDEYEAVVPQVGSPDYGRQLLNTLRELERNEGRSQAEIVRDLFRSGYDVVRIAAKGPRLKDGSISIDDGIQLFLNAQNLLLASACASVRPQTVFHSRKPPRAVEYLEKARLGQTEHGSFILTVLSPVVGVADASVRTEGLFLGDPFERAVVRTLAAASAKVVQAAQDVEARPDLPLASFQDGVKLGVSANLCEALAGFFSEEDTETVDIRIAWSALLSAPPTSPAAITLKKSSVPFIKEAARVFRRTDVLPNVVVSGPIIKLERGEGYAEGKVTIVAPVDERLRKVSFSLSATDYALATEAHGKNEYISVSGELRKVGRSWSLFSPSSFAKAGRSQSELAFDSLIEAEE